MKHLLEKIKELRIKKGLSQSEIATYLDIKQSNYGKLERGENQFTIDKLYKLSELFDIPVFLLFFSDEDDKWIFDKESELTIEAYRTKNELLEMSNEQLLKIIELKNQSEKQSNTIINQFRTLLNQQIANTKKLKDFVSKSFEQLSKAGEAELHKSFPGLSNKELEKYMESLKQYLGLDIDDSIESKIWDDHFEKANKVVELTEKMIEHDRSEKPQTK